MSVRKVTSTMASSPYGLKRASHSSPPRVVSPAPKYQCLDGSRVHGPTATSSRPRSSCSTIAGPPNTSTITPGSSVARTSATLTRRCASASTRTVRLAGGSWPRITVIVAVIGSLARLPTMIVSSARPLSVDVPSAQYQATDAASGGGITGPSTGCAATAGVTTSGALRSSATAATATAATMIKASRRRLIPRPRSRHRDRARRHAGAAVGRARVARAPGGAGVRVCGPAPTTRARRTTARPRPR